MILDFLAAIETEEEYHAIDQIFRLYYKQMLATSLRVLRNQADAEDAVMNAIKYMCDQPEEFVNYNEPKTWALILMKSWQCAIDIYRKNKKNAERFIPLNEETENFIHDLSEDTLGDALVDLEQREMFHQALNTLEMDYRTPIILKYFYHLRTREIAEFMKLTENAVDVRIHRAKKMLKKIFTDMGYQR